MTDKDILKLVTGFRKGILGRSSPLKKCFMVCSPLVTFMNGCGIECYLTEGEFALSSFKNNDGIEIGHYWITLKDGRIIDPTASQFNGMREEEMPLVYFGDKPDYYIEYKL